MFSFLTSISLASVASNETYGTYLKTVRVDAEVRPFPYKGIDRIRVYENDSGREIPLSSLNKFEQEGLVEEANAEYKFRANKKI